MTPFIGRTLVLQLMQLEYFSAESTAIISPMIMLGALEHSPSLSASATLEQYLLYHGQMHIIENTGTMGIIE